MSSLPALDQFFTLYHQAYSDKLGESPRYFPLGEVSPCVLDCDQEIVEVSPERSVQWQAVRRDSQGLFDNIEHALSITLHSSIQAFYGRYFSAPLMFDSDFGEGELLQPWNQQDFEYLQQNLIGHLMMKQKLKQPATWFIGVLGEGDEMLVVNNENGSVWIEIPGEQPHRQLADSLEDFIASLRPRVCPPQKPVEVAMPETDHPGIWQRLKTMWRHLRSGR
ncbi:SecY-interacting protein [Shewanella sp. KCT]|uniref:SecY-interacting protein n=1 Tax=Shewanella sp. KCT TaxID=2569535 RepID=UPI0011821AC2|nr:SecY-interacting protein [Shewanella sp. KCT]TVP15106.1 protein syd [Shewanella sp. KCT]